MDCSEAKDRLLDAADEALGRQEAARLEEHLDGCPACRAELSELRTGANALRRAAPELAPKRRYLTVERYASLLAARGRPARIFRLATYPQFVALAAAAAILISAATIAWHVQFAAAPQAPAAPLAPAVPLAEGPHPQGYVPVVLATHGQGEPVNVVRGIALGGIAWPPREQPAAPTLVRTDTRGVTVPVDHAFYDPDTSSHWW